ncbi:hypothetical protein CHO01_01820 [Cellulomonas hominis]|uniref:AbiEi antitoxin N-terminal domain-containing protein n=1 Tax=Cellulomonas hominis TaxID=156981 RepID=A0A511F709_9CELL|nr:type IV toxin-antitoxin system AbiEi family antitoxin domain-containing protein [Cellulomonas hominis]MBB5474141.1 hypothetical protein [Cellulomonas hominis]NKY05682.1 hypothetical protein [Cellulomonas hominis]NKY09852.1 hypothetical protein [Cellulomonas hominis]GEL45066.1 hypothetical protein CHO01_01820 [Cellulomonas hominis]
MPSASTRVLAVVSELAAGQWGLLTTAQAERAGVTRLQLARLAGADVLERVDRGVYAVAGIPAEHRGVRAAWLALDPARSAEERLADPVGAGVASHTSAAALHRLGDLLDDEPELTLPHRKQSRRGIRLHRLALAAADVTLVDGLPVTTEERTVADLLRDGHDPDHVAQIVGQGARRGVIDLDDLAERLEPLARRYAQPDGVALVEHLLDLVGLSTAALARELAASAAGQELVAAGRVAALGELWASLVSQTDTAAPTPFADAMRAAQLRSALDSTALRQAIALAASPAVTAAQRWVTSEEGRRTLQAADDLAARVRRQGDA